MDTLKTKAHWLDLVHSVVAKTISKLATELGVSDSEVGDFWSVLSEKPNSIRICIDKNKITVPYPLNLYDIDLYDYNLVRDYFQRYTIEAVESLLEPVIHRIHPTSRNLWDATTVKRLNQFRKVSILKTREKTYGRNTSV